MSSTRRSNKVSTSDTTTGKAQKGKSSHGGSKDVNNSKIKAPQPKQNPLTSLAKSNQPKGQALTAEERELFESVKKTSKKGNDSQTEQQAPKPESKGHRSPSPVPSGKEKKNGKNSVQKKTESPPQSKSSPESEEEEIEESEESERSSTKSPKTEKSDEKMIIEEEQESQEQPSSNLKPIDLAVPDPISGFIRDQQGRLTPRSDLFSFEGKSAGKSARKEDVSFFDERLRSNQKKMGSSSRKMPAILDSVLEDSDYEIQINITQIDEEGDMSQDIRGKEFRESSSRKKPATTGEKRMLKGIGSSGGYWGNVLGDLGKQDASSTDEPVRRRLAHQESDIVIRKKGEEDHEEDSVVRVIVPEGVAHEDEESQLIRSKKKNGEHAEEGDQDRKIRETMTSLKKSDILNESLFAEQMEILEQNKDLFEDEDIMASSQRDRRPANTSRMEEEEEHTQRKRNIKEALDMFGVGDRSNADENPSSKQSSQITFSGNRKGKMQVERGNRNAVEIEEEPMTGEAKTKEINAEIAKEREAKASENEESDEELERIGELEEIEDLRSPGHTDDSEEEVEETDKKKDRAGSVGSEELNKLQELEEIEEIRPGQEEANKGAIDKEIEEIEKEGNLGNIEDSEFEHSSIPASPDSGPNDKEKSQQKAVAENVEESEEDEDDEKLFESQDIQKLLSQNKQAQSQSKGKYAPIRVEKSFEEEEEVEIEEESDEEEQEESENAEEEEVVERVTQGTRKPEETQDIVVPSRKHYGGKERELEVEESIFLGDNQKQDKATTSQFHYVPEREEPKIMQIQSRKKPEREEDKEWEIDEEEEKAEEEDLLIEQAETERIVTSSRNQSFLRDSAASRKEYTAYEDWRLIEAMKWHVQRRGEEGMQSKKTWETITDPSTKKRLLNNERSGESMRNRIRRTLNVLEEEDKDVIRNYMQTHSEAEARTMYCRFEKDKWTGKKKFAGIFAQLNYNPQTLIKKSDSTSRRKRNVGRVQAAFERGELSDDIETIEESQSVIDSKLQRLIEFPGEFTNPKTMTHSVIVPRSNVTVNANANANGEKVYVFEEEGQRTSYTVRQYNPNPTIKKVVREPNQEEMLPPDTDSMPKSSVQKESGKSSASKKRKDYEDKELNGRHNCELKKVKQNDYFEQKSLIISDAFKTRRPLGLDFTLKDDLIVYLDLDEGFRQFVQDEDRLHEEPENDWVETLSLLASRYKYDMKTIGILFNQVSCDLEDLELYLKTRQEKYLWNPSQDDDLLTGNETGLRYLKKQKGEERMEKRRKFLMDS